ncbi:MAG: signal peptidase I [Bacteroidota bacterium]
MTKPKRVVIAFATVAVLTSVFSLRAYSIAGPSMSPSFWLDDLVIANHSAYLINGPERGDVIVYFDSVKNSVAVKRVIGIPGDRVELVENLVLINGSEQKQISLPGEDFRHVPEDNGIGQVIVEEDIFGRKHLVTFTPLQNPKRNYQSEVLKKDEYFILGDHRDNSNDSRYIGPIHEEQIVARVICKLRSNNWRFKR